MNNNQVKARQIPHNTDAEQAVLGCILIDDQSPMTIFSRLKNEDFYSDIHKTIFKTMFNLYKEGSPVDFVTLTDSLEKLGVIDAIGGIDYITTLTNVLPSASNYKHYMNIVKRDSVLRKLIQASNEILKDAYASEDMRKSLTFAEKQVFDVSQEEDFSSLVHIEESLKEVIDKFETIARDKDSLRGLTTGFHALDDMTNGLQKSDLILLAARPGVGKTSFAMNVVNNAAMSGAKCAIFALEMPRVQLAQRSLCSTAFVDMSKALKGELSSEEWRSLLEANKKLSKTQIFIDDSSMNTPIDILSKCRRIKQQHGLDLVMIDYLQLMSGSNKSGDNRQQEVSEMSRSLKVAARELNVPIILLSQLSRAVEQRKDHRPMLSDLRESGAIEQDADIVMFLYNPDNYETEENVAPQGVVDLIISKHRNGGLGTIKLKFIKEHTTFTNLNRDSERRSLENMAPTPASNKAGIPLPQVTPLSEDSELLDIFEED